MFLACWNSSSVLPVFNNSGETSDLSNVYSYVHRHPFLKVHHEESSPQGKITSGKVLRKRIKMKQCLIVSIDPTI